MNNKFFKLFFARLLLALQLTQLLTPHALLHAAPASPAADENHHQTFDISLPSRKVFKEVAESWEGLRPPAFIKNTSNISAGSSFEATVRLVGSQKKTLDINKKTKAIAEAIQFLNSLAAPGKALERVNCSKRMMSDLQMFHERGLFKSFNRTILSLGQALQIAQFHQGASDQKEAEQRRDFITGLLKTPEAARAIGVRLRCFSKYENQFLRQTMTQRNESLDRKIKALEPSKLFGPLRNSPAFIRWHSRIVENPFFEIGKNAYLLFAVYAAVNLFLRSLAKKTPRIVTTNLLNGDFFPEKNESITKDVTVELADQFRQNTPGASIDIAYHMARLLLSTQTQRSTLQDSSSHVRHNLKSATGTLLVGPFQIIPALLMLMKSKITSKKAAPPATRLGKLRHHLALSIFDKNYPTIPSLTAQTWEEGLSVCTSFPDFVGQKAAAFIDDVNKENKIPLLCWDGNPTSKKARDAFAALASFMDPFRSVLDHGADNQATVKGLAGIVSPTNPTLASNLIGAAAGEALLQDPDTKDGSANAAAKAEHIPLYGRWKNLTSNPLHWIFGQRATNIFLGYIPYMNWLKILTGNTKTFWKESRLFTSVIFNGIELTTRQALDVFGKDVKWPLGTFEVGGKTYSVALAPGAVASIAALEKAASTKSIPPVALFSVSTTNGELTHYLTQDEISKNSELLQQLTIFLQTNAADKIKEKLDPYSLRSKDLQKRLAELKSLKQKLKKQAAALLADKETHADDPSPKVKNLLEQIFTRKRLAQKVGSCQSADDRKAIYKTLRKLKIEGDAAKAALSLKEKDELRDIRANEKKLKKLQIKSDIESSEKEIQYHEESIGKAVVGVAKLARKPELSSRIIEGNIGLICLSLAALYTLGNPKTIEHQLETDSLDDHMFSSLKPAVALSEMVRQITFILNTHSETIPLPQSLRTKLTMLATTATPNCKTFTQLAQNKMFLSANKPALFGDYGTLRYAYKLSGMEDVQRWLGVCAAFIAEVDSYLAIARLAAEHKDAPNYFYPITFINQEAPRVELSGFWFPLIGAYKSIPNDLTIGDPAHILITGLNGGGKSFALKGLLFTILMAHTFGYGPVKEGSMTFFNKIITHLSTTDNAAEGDSCWIAEAKSMGNAIHAMQAPHGPEDRILYIGDELGSGTASAASIQAVASLIDIALEQPHVASIITTHLRPLTELEYITNGKIHNYRVGGTVSAEGVIQRKFQLERGRANINIAKLIFKQRFEHSKPKIDAPTNPAVAAPAA